MKIIKTAILPLIAGIVLLASCSGKKSDQQRLASHQWAVEQVNVEMKEKYAQLDTALAAVIKNIYKARVYTFGDDGNVTISKAGESVKAQWNFGKDDKDGIYKAVGGKEVFIVMRKPGESVEEAWLAVAGGTIFVNYGDKEEDDRIQALLAPAPESGMLVYIYLKKKM